MANAEDAAGGKSAVTRSRKAENGTEGSLEPPVSLAQSMPLAAGFFPRRFSAFVTVFLVNRFRPFRLTGRQAALPCSAD